MVSAFEGIENGREETNAHEDTRIAIVVLYRIRRRIEKTVPWLRGLFHAYVTLPLHVLLKRPIRDLATFQRRISLIERWEYSQNGEDGIIHAIFAMIGETNRFGVEFGVEDGLQSNMRYLLKHRKWKGLLMDGGNDIPENSVHKEFITAENIEALFRKHNVPEEFDLLSIDIDGNDYWVWKAITHFKPRVVIMEYNAHIPADEAKTIPYEPTFMWDKTDYYGASLLALKKLGEEKGYTLVCTDRHGVNSFFIRNDLVAGHLAPPPYEQIFRGPNFKGKGGRHPHDPQNRPWQTV